MKKFIHAMMAVVLISFVRLSGMEQEAHEIINFQNVSTDPNFYLQLAQHGAYKELQENLDNLYNDDGIEKFARSISSSLYFQVKALVWDTQPELVESQFRAIEESLYKMAMRFAFADKYRRNIDKLDVVYFLDHHEMYWINTQNFEKTIFNGCYHELLTENYLENVLPLLEHALSKKIMSLHLDSSYLQKLPKSLRLLTNLEKLDISAQHTNFTHLWATVTGMAHIILPSKIMSNVDTSLTFGSLPAWLSCMTTLKQLVVEPTIKISWNIIESLLDATIFVLLADGRLQKLDRVH